ncbi:cytochrome P450 4d2-like [Chironomus tepperi]|uniref:cytochrome P450 4d2-like n=1 Tax=Chironomus tepperi TaxID=113505 RepID=UPI00391EEB39
MLFLWFVLIIIVLLLIYDKFGFKDPRRVKCANLFAGPPTFPIIGNSLLYLNRKPEDTMPLMQYYFDTFGDSMRVWVFKRLVILTKDPRLFEILLSNQRQLTKNNLYEHLYEWLGNGLLISTGQKWFTRRKIITPTFHFKILQQFVDVFNQQNRVFVNKLKGMKSVEPFDIYDVVTLMSLDIISQTAMGVELNAQITNSEYAQTVREMTYIISNRMMHVWKRPAVIFNLTNDKVQHDKYLEVLHGFTRNIIEKRREMIVNEDIDIPDSDDESVGMKKRLALLDVLLKSNVNGQPLTNAEIAEEVDTFMFEGHDTVTATTTFTLYLLSQHPEIQQKAYEEVTKIVGDDLNVDPTYNQLLDMKYLECCIKESLRLYPPVPMIGRSLDEDLDFDGKIIPATVNVSLSIYHANRNPVYFDDPEEFKPERFLDKVLKNENAFVYVPFSAGPRNCIGQKFAMLELKSTMCHILRNFELTKSDIELKVIVQLTLKSMSGVHVGFKPRKQ